MSSSFISPLPFSVDMLRQWLQHQTMIALEAATSDVNVIIRLLHLVIQGKDCTVVEHPHFRLGFADGDEWYYLHDSNKDVPLQAFTDFVDRAALDETHSVLADLPPFEYRVGFVWGWLFALIVSGKVLHVQPVVRAATESENGLLIVGPPVENTSPRERIDAKRRTLNAGRRIAASGRRSALE